MLPTKCVSYLHLTFPIEQWDIRHDKQMRGFQSGLTPGEIFEGCRMHNCNAATHTHTKSGVMLATLVGLNKAVVTVTSVGRLWTLNCSSSSCLLQFGLEGDHILWKGHHAVLNVFDLMCWKSCSSSNGHTRAAPVNQDDDGIKTKKKAKRAKQGLHPSLSSCIRTSLVSRFTSIEHSQEGQDQEGGTLPHKVIHHAAERRSDWNTTHKLYEELKQQHHVNLTNQHSVNIQFICAAVTLGCGPISCAQTLWGSS